MIPKKLDLNFCDSSETSSNLLEIENKINQLIDYLSDKEEASKGECTCKHGITGMRFTYKCPIHGAKKHPPQQEEYKGEVGDLWNVGLPEDHPIFDKPKQEECKSFVGGDGYPRCSKCSALLLRADQLKGHKCKPVEKESRGEMDKISEILKVVGFTNNDKVHGNIVRCNRDLGELKKDLLSLIKPKLKEESPKEDEDGWDTKLVKTLMYEFQHSKYGVPDGLITCMREFISNLLLSKDKRLRDAVEAVLNKEWELARVLGDTKKYDIAHDSFSDIRTSLGLEEL